MDNGGSGFVTEPENTGSGFVTDAGGSGFVTDAGGSASVADAGGSGFVTDAGESASVADAGGSGFVTDAGGSGFVSSAQQPAGSGISSTFTDIQVLSSQGAMSTVYKGKKYGKWHIIKRIKPQFKNDPKYRELFLKEFDNGIQLDHPNIVRLEDKGEDADGLWYTMEYVDGRSLDQMIRNRELRSDSMIKNLTLQLCDALSYVHKKQIVHRDLKPENIMVTFRGDNVKVLDFGLAYSDSYDDDLKQVGTKKYAAPEQMTKGNMVDQRADIYALGLILLEMCTGDISDREANSVENPNFWTIIRKATKADPNERYYNCQEIIDDLGRNIVKLQEPKPAPVEKASAPATEPAPIPEAPKPEAPKPVEPAAPKPEPKKAVDLKDEKKKSNTGLIIGIAAAVIIIGVVVFLLMGNGGSKPDGGEQTANNEASATENKQQQATEQNNGNNGQTGKLDNENPEVKRLMEEADNLFNKDKNIARARTIYEKVLSMEPGNAKAKDMLNSCNKIMEASKISELSPIQGDNGKYGFADKEGYILIDFEYDNVKPQIMGDRLFALVKDGKYGIFDKNNMQPTTEFKYYINESKRWYTSQGGGWLLHKNPLGQVQDYISIDPNGNIKLVEKK